jgi:hypothetical protein
MSRAEFNRKAEANLRRFERTHGIQLFIGHRPTAIPPDKVLIHPRSCEFGGTYLADADDPRYARREVCDCGWAPELGTHYRRGGAETV